MTPAALRPALVRAAFRADLKPVHCVLRAAVAPYHYQSIRGHGTPLSGSFIPQGAAGNGCARRRNYRPPNSQSVGLLLAAY